MTVRELIERLERCPDYWQVQCDGQDGSIAEVREVFTLPMAPIAEPRPPYVLIVAGAD